MCMYMFGKRLVFITLMTRVSKFGQFLKRAGIACHPRSPPLQIANELRLLNTGNDSEHIQNHLKARKHFRITCFETKSYRE